jgi:hypothetical protein
MPTACTARSRSCWGSVARARAPVAVASGRARNQRRSRCRSGRRRTGLTVAWHAARAGAPVVGPSGLPLVLDDRSDGSDPEAQSAIAAYGSYDEELLDQALPVYAAWLAASFMVAVTRRPDAAPASNASCNSCDASATRPPSRSWVIRERWLHPRGRAARGTSAAVGQHGPR